MAGASEYVEFNADEWARGVADAVERWKPAGERDLMKVAIKVQNYARELCPVDTGRLRASVQAGPLQRDERGPYVEVGTNVEYAPPVEFGTVHQRGQAFLRPAFLQALNDMAAAS